MAKKSLAAALPVILLLASSSSLAGPAPSPGASGGAKKHVNLRVNPFGVLSGIWNADLDLGISDRVTLGPTLIYMNVSTETQATVGSTTVTATSQTTGMGGGLRLNLFLGHDRFTDGWYIGPNAMFVSAENRQTTATTQLSSSASSIALGAMVGHGWYWPNGMNLHFGLGFAYYDLDDAQFKGVSGVGPNGELTFGYAF